MEAIKILEEEEKREENETAGDCCGIEQFQDDAVKTAEAGLQELPKPQVLNCRNGRSRTVAFTHQELPEGHLSKIKNIQTEISENDSSPSVYPEKNSTKERTDEEVQRLNKDF